MDQKKLFRPAALERLQSPEQLDQLMEVTKPFSWVALAVLCALLALAVVWSLFGTIPTKVNASGILIRTGGVYNISGLAGGPVAAVLVKEGDSVHVGEVVARIEQPDLSRQVDNLQAQLAELERQHQQLTSYTAQDAALRTDTTALRRQQLQATIDFAQRQIKALQAQLTSQQALLDRGLTTRSVVMQTQSSIFTTQDQLESARNALQQLSLTQLTTRSDHERQIASSELTINDAKRRLVLAQQQLDRASIVASPYAGRILELKVRQGDIVAPGAPLASLQSDDSSGTLQALIYVSAHDGKNVETGMDVQISPSSAPKEEYGFIRGKVTYVSQFPATPEAMVRVLGNTSLAQMLGAQGSPFAVYAELERRPGSPDGFAWSSSKGEALTVNSGSPCSALITVLNQRPIELVIPLLKEYSGL
ncbi:MAG TPA: NHLP bacteriocin system secretion protein [Vicinamibacterales bacterium]|jgi:HlyD family secretion protein